MIFPPHSKFDRWRGWSVVSSLTLCRADKLIMSRKKKLKNKNNDLRKNCRSDDDDEEAADTSTVVLRKKSLSEVKSCNDLTEASDVLCAKNKSNLYLIKSHSFIDKASQEPDLNAIRSMLLESAAAASVKDVKKRPKSMPNSASAKRESFLRQSFHRLSRSFSRNKNKESSVGNSSNSSNASGNEVNVNEKLDKLKEEEDGGTPLAGEENYEEVECIRIEVKAGVIR